MSIRLKPFLLLLAMLSMPGLACAWQATLSDGSQISVDPTTNRALVTDAEGGGTYPLWDGVHTLADGTTITVRSGLMVPNVPLLEAREAVTPEDLAARFAEDVPCEELVDRVCGPGGACNDLEACTLARQLLSQTREGRNAISGDASWFLSQCREGLKDQGLFPACKRPVRGPRTECLRLSERVCGAEDQCAETEACRLARQLEQIERGERLLRLRPDKDATSVECRALLGDQEQYPACEPR